MKVAGKDPIYEGHLKKGKVFVTEKSVVEIHPTEGRKVDLPLDVVRCANPVRPSVVKLSWWPVILDKKTGLFSRKIQKHDIMLNLKTMYPDKVKRIEAEKTESKNLALAIIKTAQEFNGIDKPNTVGYMALHRSERMIGTHKCMSLNGLGILIITNNAICHIDNKLGLTFMTRIDLLDSYDCGKDVVTIQYFDPKWAPPNKTLVSMENRLAQFRVVDGNPDPVCADIRKAFYMQPDDK